jgi:hypothetical protein
MGNYFIVYKFFSKIQTNDSLMFQKLLSKFPEIQVSFKTWFNSYSLNHFFLDKQASSLIYSDNRSWLWHISVVHKYTHNEM